MDRAENPESGKLHVEMDELYGSNPAFFRILCPSKLTISSSRFRQKFKSFVEQYELRELHYLALSRSKESEVQLSLARAEEQRKRAEIETTKSRTLSAQVSTFSQTETELRSQLNIYVEKFKQVRHKFPLRFVLPF